MACGAAAASAALRQLGASWQADAVDRSAQPKLGGCWRRESRIAVVGNNTGVEEWKRDACREGGVARYREAASMRRAPRWQRHALPGGGKRERKTHQRPDIPANQRARNGSAASWGRQPRKSYRRSSCLPRTCPFRRPLLRHGLRGVIRLGRKKVVGVKKAAVKWPGAMHGLDVDDASTGSSQ